NPHYALQIEVQRNYIMRKVKKMLKCGMWALKLRIANWKLRIGLITPEVQEYFAQQKLELKKITNVAG
ncbi:hypothetical protein CI594_13205, partial [Fischerella thermalis CCMEE 5196]